MKKYLLNTFILLVTFSMFFTLSACKESEDYTPSIEGALPDTEGSDESLPTEPDTPNEPTPPSEPEKPSEEETPLTPTISYAYYLSSKVNSLGVRSGTSTASSKLGSINKGDMLSLEGESGNWYRTVYKEKTAYVHKDYVTLVKIAKGDDRIEKVIAIGLKLLGHPYVYGSERYHWGNGKLNYNFVPGKYDCSALMQYMFYFGNGDLLEVTSKKQYYQGNKVDELRRGDLMFFTNANGYNSTGINRVRHVGMYLGDNYILHTASDYAVIEPISQTRWDYFITAKRIIE